MILISWGKKINQFFKSSKDNKESVGVCRAASGNVHLKKRRLSRVSWFFLGGT